MEEERHGIGPNVILKGSFEDQCSLNANTSLPIIQNPISNKFSTNATNSNSSNCSSNISTQQDRFVSNATSSSNNNNNNKEQDRFLPIANVGRIMKKVIPGNGKISKDAKETVQECVSEFISFVTGEASDKCQREKRKTINGDDIIWAITTLGFEDYVMPLKQYLNRYRELEGEKLNIPKRQRIHSHDQKPNVAAYPSVYSSSPFVSTDQAFSLPFAQNLVHQQLQTHEQLDSIGHGTHINMISDQSTVHMMSMSEI